MLLKAAQNAARTVALRLEQGVLMDSAAMFRVARYAQELYSVHTSITDKLSGFLHRNRIT